MPERKLIVTHHAPDLDAITAVWLFKRFDAQDYASAQVAFVDPGDNISETNRLHLGFDASQVVHVDTGLGEFDHHQPDRGLQHISASSLVFDHLAKLHPELVTDLALQALVQHVTDVDHFGEIAWPEANHIRYTFMLHELIHGMEYLDPHNDDSQLNFGFECLDSVYAVLTQQIKAEEIIKEKGQPFNLGSIKCLALDTRNDETLKLAQKMGYDLVIRKDTEQGHVRIKVRPDQALSLESLYTKILEIDSEGTWYYHPSGKMLLNGSRKHRSQKATPLGLNKIIDLIKKIYA
ncbi:MAG: hypothetical protein ABIJ03_02935 [Patescibacteria group bacterium]|nr:hypothetical protein [Patescibacteria group bacterium]